MIICQGDAHTFEEYEDLQKKIVIAPALEENPREKIMDSFYCLSSAQVRSENAKSTIERNGLIVCKDLIDGAIQVLVPTVLGKPLLYEYCYPLSAGRAGLQRMYDSTCRDFYRPHLENEVFHPVSKSATCAPLKPTESEEVNAAIPSKETAYLQSDCHSRTLALYHDK